LVLCPSRASHQKLGLTTERAFETYGEAAIEGLQEYRPALITAAVTGKMDMRKEVAA
jgi:hypothetical protein